jgi:hypothetical protein
MRGQAVRVGSSRLRLDAGFSRGNNIVFSTIQILEKEAGRIKNPVQEHGDKQQAGENSGQDKTISRSTEGVADCAHCQWPKGRSSAGEKKNYSGNSAMFRFSEAADALGVDGGIYDGHEESRKWQQEYGGSNSPGHTTQEADKNRKAENGDHHRPIQAAEYP